MSSADQKSEIRWLVAEPDWEDPDGYYLYHIKQLGDAQFGDSWHESLCDLYQVASRQYGVELEDWKCFESVEAALEHQTALGSEM